jgi:hypothetical protein
MDSGKKKLINPTFLRYQTIKAEIIEKSLGYIKIKITFAKIINSIYYHVLDIRTSILFK